jgi:hypothetical protein
MASNKLSSQRDIIRDINIDIESIVSLVMYSCVLLRHTNN